MSYKEPIKNRTCDCIGNEFSIYNNTHVTGCWPWVTRWAHPILRVRNTRTSGKSIHSSQAAYEAQNLRNCQMSLISGSSVQLITYTGSFSSSNALAVLVFLVSRRQDERVPAHMELSRNQKSLYKWKISTIFAIIPYRRDFSLSLTIFAIIP